MPTSGSDATNDHLLVLAPAGRDAGILIQILGSAGLRAEIDVDGRRLLSALREGRAAGAVVTPEGLSRLDPALLRRAIEGQPPWSDFPFVLLSRRGETLPQGSRSIDELGNVTILERPLHPATLVSAARSAIRGRRRQRLAEAYLGEREAAEARLRELAETLEQKVRERTRELAAANDRLTAEIAERERAEARLLQSQKMEALGRLTGGIAHDFNNLLTAVIGSLDLVLRRTDDEKLLRLVRNALEGAERAAGLTAQLLAFSRRQRLAPAAVNANAVITGMGDLLARTLGAHIRVETRLEPHLWAALADRTQLEVMILNLAINARDAMPAGGRLTIETRNVEAPPRRIAAEVAPGAYVAVSVHDTGIGMPPATLARAFEPFFTTKEPGKGTGLGLSQVYGFARQSGGTVTIDSREREGTVVTIYLPRTEAAEATNREAGRRIAAGGRARILLVDDDDNVRAVAASMLEELGYDVTAVESGAAALEALHARAFDLLLSDIVMPGMHGVELARRARALAPAMPVLFASGYADTGAFGETLSDADIIRKPYRMAEIASRIAAALGDAADGGNVVKLRP